MKELAKDAAKDVADLLSRFSFDLNGFSVDQLAHLWLTDYPAHWVRFALIEALYQGRYKAFSVERILRLWHRRGQPLYHFNHEFERIIRGRFSKDLLTYPMPRQTRKLDRSNLSARSGHSPTKVVLTQGTANESSPVESIAPLPSPEQDPGSAWTEPIAANSLAEQWLQDADAFEPALPDPWFEDEASANESISARENVSVRESISAEEISAQFIDPLAASRATPESAEIKAEADIETDLQTDIEAEAELFETDEMAIQSLSHHLQLLSPEESIAFLKLRSFEAAAVPVKEIPIQAFRPITEPDDSALTKMKCLNLAANHPPIEEIHQFVPRSDSPTFYSKLKAVVTASTVADGAEERLSP